MKRAKWKVDKELPFLIQSEHLFIAMLAPYASERIKKIPSDTTRAANVRLIVNAPELLEVLKDIVFQIHSAGLANHFTIGWAQNVIKKVEGRRD